MANTIPMLPPEGDQRTWIRLSDGSVATRGEGGTFDIPAHLAGALKGWSQAFNKLAGSETPLAKSAPSITDQIGALWDTAVTLGQRERHEITKAISNMHDAVAAGDIPGLRKALSDARAVSEELQKEETQSAALKKCLATPRRMQ